MFKNKRSLTVICTIFVNYKNTILVIIIIIFNSVQRTKTNKSYGNLQLMREIVFSFRIIFFH